MNGYMKAPYPCVFCSRPTDFGSGRFVNRLPADNYHELPDGTTQYRDGFACAECMALPCDRCPEDIPLDEDISAYQVYGDSSGRDTFDDGAYRIHEECLTLDEKILYDAQNAQEERTDSRYDTKLLIKRDVFKELTEDELLLEMREEIFILSARLEDAVTALGTKRESYLSMQQAEQTLCQAFRIIDDRREDLAEDAA